MKVLLQGRLGLLRSGGGDKVQILNTAKELRNLGVTVDICDDMHADYSAYDIIHTFQLDWTPDAYFYAKKAKKANKPFVLSPIHHQLAEVRRFDDVYLFDLRRIISFFFKNQFTRDTLKNIYKSFFYPRGAYLTITSVFLGLKSMHKKVLQMSNIVLVQTDLEAKDLGDVYGVPIKWVKVPNGVGEHFVNFDTKPEVASPMKFEDYIFCVGRIEARKNQLSIIKAVKNLRKRDDMKNVNLVFVGRKSRLKHMEYIYRFNRILNKESWITYITAVPYEEIPAYFRFAKVGVSTSWFESTGLTSLEALFCGTNAVASGGPAKEYLGDLVTYCDPASIKSIEEAIYTQYKSPRPKATKQMLQEYTWKNAAKKTLAVYNSIL